MASLHSSDVASGITPDDAKANSYYANQTEPSKTVRLESNAVDADVRTGTKAHQISAAHMLSLNAAVKEGLDNVLGIAQATGQARHFHVFLTDVPTSPLGSAEEYSVEHGMGQVGKEHLVLLSDTRALAS